jgi:sugar lactone lactonase YvrE
MITLASSCRGGDSGGDAAPAQDALLVSVTGLSGPEAVRYDPDLDVYFVANFNGDPAGDANGFVSRVLPDGTVDSLRFMRGTESAPLHGARGMYITGDTLWVADANGVHGFSRQTGQQLAFVDMSAFSPGFLNDITRGPDGALYVTDTDGRRVFRLAGGAATIALDSAPMAPNGITWDAGSGRFLLASWSEGTAVYSWDGTGALVPVGDSTGGGNDGIEVLPGGVLYASQPDSSLHLIEGTVTRRVLRLPGEPADIGVDKRRGRVAVPYVSLNRVDIWPLPGPQQRR